MLRHACGLRRKRICGGLVDRVSTQPAGPPRSGSARHHSDERSNQDANCALGALKIELQIPDFLAYVALQSILGRMACSFRDGGSCKSAFVRRMLMCHLNSAASCALPRILQRCFALSAARHPHQGSCIDRNSHCVLLICSLP